MKYRHMHLAIFTLLTANILGTEAYADWGVSMSLANQKSQYKDDSNKVIFIPDITYRESGESPQDKTVSYDVIFTSKNAGFRAKDGNVFDGMTTRKSSLDVGGKATINNALMPLTVEASKDFVASKGYQASIKLGGLTSNYTSERLQVMPYAGVRYESSKVIHYHYGVRSGEATASRKSYSGKSATTPFLGFEAATKLSKNIQLNANFAFEKRASSISNSPLVNDKKNDVKGFIGLTYWF